MTTEDLPASRKTKTLDELHLEIERHLPESQMTHMKRKKRVSCFMNQEKQSTIQVVDDVLLEQ